MGAQGEPPIIRLLSDEPADTDSFGGHDRVAEAMAQLIRSNDGGHAIALLGPWGSGKSTVVGLLRRKLLAWAGHSAEVFVFDAWAHEGNPLRLTFVEELVSVMQGWGWLRRRGWDRDLDRLAKRRSTTDRTETPILTPCGRVIMALLVVATPMGLVGLRECLKAGRPDCYCDGAYWINSALALSPLLLLLCLRAWKGLATRPARQRGEPPSDDDPLWSILASKSAVRSRSEVIETPEPTSLEFGKVFGKAMGEALSRCRTRRLVIVIDNLDRVAPCDALRLWATMQTFFAPPHGGCAAHDWRKQLWLVAPFAPEGIEHLWSDVSREPRDHFVNKTFQAVFRVPPPLLSDWRSYVRERVAAAIPELASAEARLHEVSSVYGWAYAYCAQERRDRVAREAPTPREVTRFANQLAALHLKWHVAGPDIPLAALAAYAALSVCRGIGETMSDLVDPAREGVLADPDLLRFVGGDPLVHFARIYYGAQNRGKAMQIALGPRIEAACRGRDSDELRELAGRPGFWPVFETQLTQWTTDTTVLIGVAELLEALAVQPGDAVAARAAWRLLATVMERAPWERPTRELGGAIARVLGHAPPGTDPRAIVAAAVRAKVPDGVDQAGAAARAEWADGVAEFVRVVDPDNTGVPFDSRFRAITQLNADYLEILAHLGSLPDPPSRWRCLVSPLVDGQRQQLAEASERKALGQPVLDVTGVASIVPLLVSAGQTDGLTEALVSPLGLLAGGCGGHAPTLIAAVRALLRLWSLDREVVEGALRDKCLALGLVADLWLAMDHGEPLLDVLGAVMPLAGLTQDAAQLASDMGGRAGQPAERADSGDADLPTALRREAEMIGTAEWLLPFAASTQWLGLRARDAVLQIVDTGLAEYVRFERRADGYGLLVRSQMPIGARDAIVRAAVEARDLCGALAAEGFDKRDAAYYGCVLAHATGPVREGFVRFLREGLAALRADDWRQIVWDSVVSNGPLADAVSLVHAVGGPTDAVSPPSLYDGIIAASEQLYSGPDPGTEGPVPIGEIIDLLPSDQLASCLTKLHDDHGKRAGSGTVGWLTLFGPALLHSDVSREAMDAVVLGAFADLAKHGRAAAACIWLVDAVRGDARPLSRCRASTARTFLEGLPVALEAREQPDEWTPEMQKDLVAAVQEVVPSARTRKRSARSAGSSGPDAS